MSRRYSSGTKREFVSRDANPTSFTGSKFIQAPLARRRPLAPGACQPLRQGVSVRSGQLSLPDVMGIQVACENRKRSSSCQLKNNILPPSPHVLPAPTPTLKGTQETNVSGDVRPSWERALTSWPGHCVQVPGARPSPFSFPHRSPYFLL